MHVHVHVWSWKIILWALSIDCVLSVDVGEKLTDDEVDALLTGVEDSQGQVNYEGQSTVHSFNSDII